jgi:hypothetical protein
LGSVLSCDTVNNINGEPPVRKITLSALSMVLFAATGPAFAQDATGPKADDEKINQLIIYGDDPCPQSNGDEIVVCARLSEGDRYRIPKKLRDVENTPVKEAWNNRVLAYEHVAASGTMSCSAVGAGGFTGCGLKDIDSAYAEKSQDIGLAFGRLIAEERNKRLAGIDAESELVEERVLDEERAAAAKKLQDQGNNILSEDSGDVIAEELPSPN